MCITILILVKNWMTVTFDVYNYINFSQNWMTVTFDVYNYINFSQNFIKLNTWQIYK